MKIAIKTLNRYLKHPRSTEEMVALLGRTEIEVEQVLYSSKLDPKIILAKVMEVYPHPNADKLRLATITTGKKKAKLVCGAPNLAVGQRVAYVQPGSVLPDGFVIERREIRGQMSQGMLASAKELGLSDDHTGILVLEVSSHRLGTSLCDIIENGDVLDIKTPANRWDYLSGEGIGREVAAYDVASQAFRPVETGEYDYSEIEYVDVKAREENRRFLSACVRVDNSRPSPAWLVDNLAANGLVSRGSVVDITNFVMLETGQPAHAYDRSTLSGSLSTRFARDGEKLTTLDDVTRTLSSHDLVVCDAAGPIGLAGVMGSAHTQIRPDTTEIVLEVASWDKTCVRRTALRHGLRTEASARYERSLPLPLAPHAFARLLDLLTEICGAEIVEGPFDQLYAWPWQQQLGLRLRRAERFLGQKLDEKAMIAGLRRLGFGVQHFSITRELKQHLGKPYVWGATYRKDKENGFDCSYLIDRVYSKIGVFVGHVALGQFHHGRPVEVDELKPGDALFIRGLIELSPTTHYYTTTPQGKKERIDLPEPMEVGHNGVYIGNGQVIHASRTQFVKGAWVNRSKPGVIISPVEEFTQDAGYLGARRYVEDFNHIYAVTVPWWRTDVRLEEDLYEELGKLADYNTLPSTLPAIPPMPMGSEPLVDLMDVRRKLCSLGLTEIATYSFVSAQARDISGVDPELFLPIANPRSPEQAYVRASLLPSHLEVMRQQLPLARGRHTCFELSRVFLSKGLIQQPDEPWRLGFGAVAVDALERIQAVLQRVAAWYHVDLQLEPGAGLASLVPQRSARILLAGQAIGVIGQVATKVARQAGLKQPVAWCECDIVPVLEAAVAPALRMPPEYQLVERTISLELAATVWWQAVAAALQGAPHLWSYVYIDRYLDDALAATRRQVLTCTVLLDCGPQPSAQLIESRLADVVGRLEQKLADAKPSLR